MRVIETLWWEVIYFIFSFYFLGKPVPFRSPGMKSEQDSRYPLHENYSTETTPLPLTSATPSYATLGPASHHRMEKLHSTRLRAWAHKLQVDHEEGLTTAQLMVRLLRARPHI